MTSDAAKRASDIMTELAHEPVNHFQWIALRLSDGGYDNTVYENRPDCLRHNLNTPCMILQIQPDGMPPQHAERVLAFHRAAHDAGLRMTDPEDNRQLIMPYGNDQWQKTMGVLPRRYSSLILPQGWSH